MKIVKLTAENFMRLVAVEITPQGNAIMITGKNAAGKSSVLDAIMAAFCGKKYQPAKPIRETARRRLWIWERMNSRISATLISAGASTSLTMPALPATGRTARVGRAAEPT